MESWAIFKHAVRMVFQNLGDAVRVTGVPFVALFALQFLLLGSLMADQQAMQQRMMDGAFPWLQFVIYLAAAVVLVIWSLVGWHRYVLLNENPRAIPAFHGPEIGAYFGKSVQLVLVMIPVVIVSSLIGGIIGAGLGFVFGSFMSGPVLMGSLVAIGAMLGYIPAFIVSYRLAPLFPSAALGKAMTLREAWGKLVGKNKMLLALGLITAVGIILLSIPTFALMRFPILSAAYGFIAGWLQMVVGASIVTTLYGRFVEGRSLDLA